MVRVVEGLHPDEVMREHRVNGKRVAYRFKREYTSDEWELCRNPIWGWDNLEYAIIDDTEPTVDFSEFDWDFFNQYDGLPVKFHRDPNNIYPIRRTPHESPVTLVETPWYLWRGGKCPVPGNAQVHCVLRDNSEIFFKASSVSWDHTDTDEDAQVIGFRLTGIIY